MRGIQKVTTETVSNYGTELPNDPNTTTKQIKTSIRQVPSIRIQTEVEFE